MKNSIKIITIAIIAIFIVLTGYFISSKFNPNIDKLDYELITNQKEISDLVTDSFLDILIEAKNFDISQINYEDMLQATMRISRELNLFHEMSNDIDFYEYIPEEIIHKMIFELTGEKVKSPIDIKDFYYLYNDEAKYYYIVPVGTDWIHIDEVKEVRKINNGEYYTIVCSTYLTEESVGEINYGDITVTLKHCPGNEYIRYQLVSMVHSSI